MTDLGETLKEARLKKGYDLEDIQKITKIQKRYLEAIEAGNLDALPGHFYARAFVKSYAEAVGLAPETVLEQIKPTELPPPHIEEPRVPLRSRREERSPIQTGRWLSKTLLYLFAVLILFVIYIAVSELNLSPPKEEGLTAPNAGSTQPNQGATAPGGMDQTRQPVPTTPPPAQQPEQTPKPTLSYVTRIENVYKYELTGTKEIQISITAVGNCWLRLVKGGQNGEKVDEVTLTKGTTKTWTLADTSEAWLRLGSAPDVQIQVNGQGLDTSIMTRSSQIISIALK